MVMSFLSLRGNITVTEVSIVPYSAVIMSILIKLRHRQSRRSRKRVRLRNRETKEQEKETLSEA